MTPQPEGSDGSHVLFREECVCNSERCVGKSGGKSTDSLKSWTALYSGAARTTEKAESYYFSLLADQANV